LLFSIPALQNLWISLHSFALLDVDLTSAYKPYANQSEAFVRKPKVCKHSLANRRVARTALGCASGCVQTLAQPKAVQAFVRYGELYSRLLHSRRLYKPVGFVRNGCKTCGVACSAKLSKQHLDLQA
jgi:hypothetical protein